MTQDQARIKVKMVGGDDTRVTGDLIDDMLLEAAEEVGTIGNGPYRNTITPSSTAGLRYVSLVNGAVYDMLWPIEALYDGKRMDPAGSMEEMDEWRRIHGTELHGTPQRYCVDNKHDPRTLWFDRIPDEAKVVTIVYAKRVAAFTDLPAQWHKHAVNLARATYCRILEKETQAESWQGQYDRFARRLARKLKQSHSEVQHIVVRNHWLFADLGS